MLKLAADLPSSAIPCPRWITNTMSYAALTHAINLTTKKEQVAWPLQWWVLQFLFGKIFHWNVPLTCHLLSSPPSMNWKCNAPHHALPWNLSNNKKTRPFVHSSGECCNFYVDNYLTGTCCSWPAIFCQSPWPWISNPMPHAAPSSGNNLTATKSSRSIDQSSGEYCKFFCDYLFGTLCPGPAIFCHSLWPWISNPMPHAAHSCSINLTTKRRRRTVDHST